MSSGKGDREGKQLLAKIRFREWVDTIAELSSFERRVSGVLITRYNFARGFGWPPLEDIAADLGKADVNGKRMVQRAVRRLVGFEVWTATPGGGRGHSTEYRPRFDRVPPDGDVYQSCRQEKVTRQSPFSDPDALAEKVTIQSEKVTTLSVKGDSAVTPNGSLNDLSKRSSDEASPGGDASLAGTDDEAGGEPLPASLRRLETTLKEIEAGEFKPDQAWIDGWYDFVEGMWLELDSQDLLAGWAGRLMGELYHLQEALHGG